MCEGYDTLEEASSKHWFKWSPSQGMPANRGLYATFFGNANGTSVDIQIRDDIESSGGVLPAANSSECDVSA